MDTVALLLRVRFFGVRIQKWICDLRSYGFFTTKKPGRSEFWIFPKKRALLFDAITVSMETVMIMLSIVSKSK